MEYRREIDGLRAVAVIPVIFFHAGFEWFAGGFIGVDVFFVISGYLITSIILAEKERGTFSIVTFYERRARRILPALFFVMLACIPFAYLWLLPSDLKDFFQSIAAVSLFSSNILFWIESGYFEPAAELKPLLHTWSLAVEEQFYLLFPLFLVGLWALRKRWIFGGLVSLGIASLIFSQWSAANYPAAGFFLLPSRAWELMIGACVAFVLMYGGPAFKEDSRHAVWREWLGITGLSMIMLSIMIFDEETPFPSLWALLPTVGTALIILYSTRDTLIGRVLGSGVLVAVGLISYSAYLWHQPLFAFARHRSHIEPSGFVFGVLSVLTVLLAYVSWRYVERPFRQKKVMSKRLVFSFALAGTLGFLATGTIGHLANGFDGRLANDGTLLAELDDRIRTNYGLIRGCDRPMEMLPECRTADEPEILVWGDSYAMHLVQGILSSNPSAKIIQMTKSVCGPIFDLAPTSAKYPVTWAEECLEFTASVREYLQSNQTIKYVVLSSPFRQYLSEDFEFFYDGKSWENSEEVALEKLYQTLLEIEAMGFRPTVFSPPPSNGTDLGKCLVKASHLYDGLAACDFEVEKISKARQKAYRFLSRVEQHYPIVWLRDYICDEKTCRASVGKKFIYRDEGHLSHEGSAALGESADFYSLITRD